MKKKNNFFAMALALMPILNNYQFLVNGIGVGDVLVAIALLRIIIRNDRLKVSRIHFPLQVFFLYGLIISLITLAIHVSFSVRDVAVRLVIFAFYTVIICLPSNEDFDKEIFVKHYLSIATICCAFLIVQAVFFYVFGKIFLGIIPGLPLNYSISNYSELLLRYSSLYSYFYRPSSLFLEPAHFAQFMGPALSIVLFDERVKNRLFYAVFFSVSVLLSTSTNAIVIVASIWLLYLLYENLKAKRLGGVLRILGIVASIVIVGVIASRLSETFTYGISRIQRLISGGEAYGSAYERVMKGFDIWKQLGLGERIFGIGYGTYDSYYALGTISVYNGAVEYMSSISYVMVCGGIVSLLLFAFVLIEYLRSKNVLNIVMATFLIIVFFSSSVINTPIYAIVMLWISHHSAYCLKK